MRSATAFKVASYSVLAAKVVIEQRLVDAGRLCNALCTRAGQAVGAELLGGGIQNAGAGLVGAFGLRTRLKGVHHLLTNWLVN
jgi:hypothetical protein